MILSGYQDHLKGFDLSRIDDASNTSIAIDKDFKIIYLNSAYFNFAEQNKGIHIESEFGLGSNFLEAIGGDLKEFYADYFNECMQADSSLNIDYECSSPEKFRQFKMHIYPLLNNNGILMEHSLKVCEDHTRLEVEFDEKAYLNEHDIISQCGHCRRIRNVETGEWEWCPAVFDYKNISHGLCQPCRNFFYTIPRIKRKQKNEV